METTVHHVIENDDWIIIPKDGLQTDYWRRRIANRAARKTKCEVYRVLTEVGMYPGDTLTFCYRLDTE